VTCPVCGTVAVPNARFCHHCGAALPAFDPPQAERRVVTVLFGDLSDFTAWAEDIDPERVGAVTDRVLAALAGAVKTFGGHVDKLTGDGIMAVFGAPVAHEDDADRAVRAALSMQQAVRRVLDDERGGGAPLGLRVGLNTGEVVAGVQASLEYTVIGDTVNTAARLADAAAVGAVYAGAATAAASRRVASWRTLRPLRLKGKREPVETYELLGLTDAPGTRSGLADEAPFVGRETELARVARRLAEVVDRRESRVLVATAEAGIGKTRFAAEVARFAAGYDAAPPGYPAGGVQVLSVRCAAYGESRRLGPLADLVREAIGLPDGPTPPARDAVEERLRRFAQRLGKSRETPVRVPTEPLLALLGYADGTGPSLTPDGTARSGGGVSGPEVPGGPHAIPDAVAALLDALSGDTALVVVVDDLHDATPTAVAALAATLNRVTGPVLALLLGRPELVRGTRNLTGLADAEVMALPPLRGADAARLLSSYLGGGRLPQPDEDRLLATAQGNPFYLAELVTLLLERGSLTSGRHGWRLAPDSLGSGLLSRDLAAVLAARIDALPPEARSVLRDAAVVGEEVPAGALEALRQRRAAGDGRSTSFAVVALHRSVEELLQRRMLRHTRSGYAFATPLMREAVYAGIGRTDLADRHAYLAAWAAGTDPAGAGMTESARDEFVAMHAERAVSLADSVGLRTDAHSRSVAPLGVRALARLATNALAQSEPALAVRSGERAAALGESLLTPSELLIHSRALNQVGRAAEALAVADQVAAGAADDVPVRVRALLAAGQAHLLLGHREEAYRAWTQAVAATDGTDLLIERSHLQRRLGMADYLMGRLAEAGDRLTQAYEIAIQAGDTKGQAWSLQNLAWVETTRGDFAGADIVIGRAARLFGRLRDPAGRAWLRGTTAFGRLLAGRLAEAGRLARIFLPFGERVGEQWAVGTLRAVEAFAAAELGELAEADRQARRAYRDFAAASDIWGRGLALVVRGVVARGLGEPEHARDLLTDALGYAEQTSHPLLLGMAHTVRGFVGLELGDLVSAEADAHAALAVVEPPDVLEPAQVGPHALLAMVRLAQGDAAAAVALLKRDAEAALAPATLFPRRQTLAVYARALLALGQVDEAMHWARRAVELSAEDVRSEVVALRTLALAFEACGQPDAARAHARRAVEAAGRTEQTSERAAAAALLARLDAVASAPG
jgi:class 3 adenylate cyclase/tetratricopeptide (TPR) repeat protein